MSFEDDARQLRSLASAEHIPIDLLNAATSILDALVEKIQHVVGTQSQHLPTLAALVGEVRRQIDDTIGAMHQIGMAIEEAADAHGRG